MVHSATFLARVISDGRITIPNEVRSLLTIEDDDFVTCTVAVTKELAKSITEQRGDLPLLSKFANLLEVCRDPRGLEEKSPAVSAQSYLGFLMKEGLIARKSKTIDGKETVVYQTTHAGNLMISRLGGVKYA